MVPFSQLGPECPMQPLASKGKHPGVTLVNSETKLCNEELDHAQNFNLPFSAERNQHVSPVPHCFSNEDEGAKQHATMSQEDVDSSEDDSTTWYDRLRNARQCDETVTAEHVQSNCSKEDNRGAVVECGGDSCPKLAQEVHTTISDEKNDTPLCCILPQDASLCSDSSAGREEVQDVAAVESTSSTIRETSMTGDGMSSDTIVGENWVQLETTAGQVYYWNRLDDTTSLDLPVGIHAKWIQQRLRDGRSYYWTRDGESTWNLQSLAKPQIKVSEDKKDDDEFSKGCSVTAEQVSQDAHQLAETKHSPPQPIEECDKTLESLSEDVVQLAEISAPICQNVEVEEIITKHLLAKSAWEKKVLPSHTEELPSVGTTLQPVARTEAETPSSAVIDEASVSTLEASGCLQNELLIGKQELATSVSISLLDEPEATLAIQQAPTPLKATSKPSVQVVCETSVVEDVAFETAVAELTELLTSVEAMSGSTKESSSLPVEESDATKYENDDDVMSTSISQQGDTESNSDFIVQSSPAATESDKNEQHPQLRRVGCEDAELSDGQQDLKSATTSPSTCSDVEKSFSEDLSVQPAASEPPLLQAEKHVQPDVAEKDEETIKLRIELAMLRGELEAQTRLIEAKFKSGYNASRNTATDPVSSQLVCDGMRHSVQPVSEPDAHSSQMLGTSCIHDKGSEQKRSEFHVTSPIVAQSKVEQGAKLLEASGNTSSGKTATCAHRDVAQCRKDTKDAISSRSRSKRKGDELKAEPPQNKKMDSVPVCAQRTSSDTKPDHGHISSDIGQKCSSETVSDVCEHVSKQIVEPSNLALPPARGNPVQLAESVAREKNILEDNEELRRDLEEFESELPILKRRRAASRPKSPLASHNPQIPEHRREKPDPCKHERAVESERRTFKETKSAKKGGVAVNALRSLFGAVQKQVPGKPKSTSAEKQDENSCKPNQSSKVNDDAKKRSRSQSGKPRSSNRDTSPKRKQRDTDKRSKSRKKQNPTTREASSKSSQGGGQSNDGRTRQASSKSARTKLGPKRDQDADSRPASGKQKSDAIKDTASSKSLKKESALSDELMHTPSTKTSHAQLAPKKDHNDTAILERFLTSVRYGAPPGNWGNDTVGKVKIPGSQPMQKQSDACRWASSLGA